MKKLLYLVVVCSAIVSLQTQEGYPSTEPRTVESYPKTGTVSGAGPIQGTYQPGYRYTGKTLGAGPVQRTYETVGTYTGTIGGAGPSQKIYKQGYKYSGKTRGAGPVQRTYSKTSTSDVE